MFPASRRIAITRSFLDGLAREERLGPDVHDLPADRAAWDADDWNTLRRRTERLQQSVSARRWRLDRELHIAEELARSEGKPGPFYVTALSSGGRVAFLAGPFARHEDALRCVPWARTWARENARGADEASYGTARVRDGDTGGVEVIAACDAYVRRILGSTPVPAFRLGGER